MYFLIGLIVSFISAFIGWLGVQRTGNYENGWGAMLLWSIPVYLVVAGLLFLVL